MADEEYAYIDTSVFYATLAKANIELIQKVDRLINKLEDNDVILDHFINEMRNRILFETIDMDSDAKYLIRGVVESVLHDMKNTER